MKNNNTNNYLTGHSKKYLDKFFKQHIKSKYGLLGISPNVMKFLRIVEITNVPLSSSSSPLISCLNKSLLASQSPPTAEKYKYEYISEKVEFKLIIEVQKVNNDYQLIQPLKFTVRLYKIKTDRPVKSLAPSPFISHPLSLAMPPMANIPYGCEAGAPEIPSREAGAVSAATCLGTPTPLLNLKGVVEAQSDGDDAISFSPLAPPAHPRLWRLAAYPRGVSGRGLQILERSEWDSVKVPDIKAPLYHSLETKTFDKEKDKEGKWILQEKTVWGEVHIPKIDSEKDLKSFSQLSFTALWESPGDFIIRGEFKKEYYKKGKKGLRLKKIIVLGRGSQLENKETWKSYSNLNQLNAKVIKPSILASCHYGALAQLCAAPPLIRVKGEKKEVAIWLEIEQHSLLCCPWLPLSPAVAMQEGGSEVATSFGETATCAHPHIPTHPSLWPPHTHIQPVETRPHPPLLHWLMTAGGVGEAVRGEWVATPASGGGDQPFNNALPPTNPGESSLLSELYSILYFTQSPTKELANLAIKAITPSQMKGHSFTIGSKVIEEIKEIKEMIISLFKNNLKGLTNVVPAQSLGSPPTTLSTLAHHLPKLQAEEKSPSPPGDGEAGVATQLELVSVKGSGANPCSVLVKSGAVTPYSVSSVHKRGSVAEEREEDCLTVKTESVGVRDTLKLKCFNPLSLCNSASEKALNLLEEREMLITSNNKDRKSRYLHGNGSDWYYGSVLVFDLGPSSVIVFFNHLFAEVYPVTLFNNFDLTIVKRRIVSDKLAGGILRPASYKREVWGKYRNIVKFIVNLLMSDLFIERDNLYKLHNMSKDLSLYNLSLPITDRRTFINYSLDKDDLTVPDLVLLNKDLKFKLNFPFASKLISEYAINGLYTKLGTSKMLQGQRGIMDHDLINHFKTWDFNRFFNSNYDSEFFYFCAAYSGYNVIPLNWEMDNIPPVIRELCKNLSGKAKVTDIIDTLGEFNERLRKKMIKWETDKDKRERLKRKYNSLR